MSHLVLTGGALCHVFLPGKEPTKENLNPQCDVMCSKPLCSWRILCYSMLPMFPPSALHGTNIHSGVLRLPNVI